MIGRRSGKWLAGWLVRDWTACQTPPIDWELSSVEYLEMARFTMSITLENMLAKHDGNKLGNRLENRWTYLLKIANLQYDYCE